MIPRDQSAVPRPGSSAKFSVKYAAYKKVTTSVVNAEFAQTLRRILKPGGIFHMATDWQPYSEHMLEVMDVAEGYENIAGKGQCVDRPDHRPYTKFEKRGERKGHGVWDIMYRKVS